MKKLLLSLAVIVTFGLYAYALRHPEKEEGKVIAPNNLSDTPATTSSNNQPANLPSPTSTTNTPTPVTTSQKYKNGSFTGSVEDAFYGNIQVKAIIAGGNITDVVFLQYPNDRGNSIEINSQAMPILKSEAIQAQSASVDIVSGATASSMAFQKSLATALQAAKN